MSYDDDDDDDDFSIFSIFNKTLQTAFNKKNLSNKNFCKT